MKHQHIFYKIHLIFILRANLNLTVIAIKEELEKLCASGHSYFPFLCLYAAVKITFIFC